jgi:hypothetical protein
MNFEALYMRGFVLSTVLSANIARPVYLWKRLFHAFPRVGSRTGKRLGKWPAAPEIGA